jgi:hypothetical protein
MQKARVLFWGCVVAMALALGVSALLLTRPDCTTGTDARKGEMRLGSRGEIESFDGRCWIRKSSPPQDMPF